MITKKMPTKASNVTSQEYYDLNVVLMHCSGVAHATTLSEVNLHNPEIFEVNQK